VRREEGRDDLNYIDAVVGLHDPRDPNKEFRSDVTFDLYLFPDGVVWCGVVWGGVVLCCVYARGVWRERSQQATGLSKDSKMIHQTKLKSSTEQKIRSPRKIRIMKEVSDRLYLLQRQLPAIHASQTLCKIRFFNHIEAAKPRRVGQIEDASDTLQHKLDHKMRRSHRLIQKHVGTKCEGVRVRVRFGFFVGHLHGRLTSLHTNKD
jgi:hypothetical protein